MATHSVDDIFKRDSSGEALVKLYIREECYSTLTHNATWVRMFPLTRKYEIGKINFLLEDRALFMFEWRMSNEEILMEKLW